MKQYLIADTRHEIVRYTYVVEAENEEEAEKKFERGDYYDEQSDFIDCTSSTMEIDELSK